MRNDLAPAPPDFDETDVNLPAPLAPVTRRVHEILDTSACLRPGWVSLGLPWHARVVPIDTPTFLTPIAINDLRACDILGCSPVGRVTNVATASMTAHDGPQIRRLPQGRTAPDEGSASASDNHDCRIGPKGAR